MGSDRSSVTLCVFVLFRIIFEIVFTSERLVNTINISCHKKRATSAMCGHHYNLQLHNILKISFKWSSTVTLTLSCVKETVAALKIQQDVFMLHHQHMAAVITIHGMPGSILTLPWGFPLEKLNCACFKRILITNKDTKKIVTLTQYLFLYLWFIF